MNLSKEWESVKLILIEKTLFEFMLNHQNIEPDFLGYDRPSTKLLGFLKKHYSLTNFIPQNNNFVVFNNYFQKKQDIQTNTISDCSSIEIKQRCTKHIESQKTLPCNNYKLEEEEANAHLFPKDLLRNSNKEIKNIHQKSILFSKNLVGTESKKSSHPKLGDTYIGTDRRHYFPNSNYHTTSSIYGSFTYK